MTTWPDSLTLGPIREWPGTRTAAPRPGPFKATLRDTLRILRAELWHLDGDDEVLLMGLRPEDFRLDGRPRANAQPEHQGVILTVTTKHGPMSWPCDTFTHWHDNLRAISLALEALRKIDRYGVTGHGEQYRGFLAIEPARAAPPAMTLDLAIDTLARWSGGEFGPGSLRAAGPEAFGRAVRIAIRNTHPDTAPRANPDAYPSVMAATSWLRENRYLL
jgi:hypothetical protein